MTEVSKSPPTRRVVAVVDLLVGAQHALSTTQVAARLAISRPTALAVLAELQSAGWVQRDAALAYSLGPVLSRLRREPTDGDPTVQAAGGVLANLARATKCGVTMSFIDADHLVVVDKKHGGDRIVPGFPVGKPIPLRYPVGAAVMPWRSADVRRKWLASATGPSSAAEDLLASVREVGFVIFRPGDGDAGLVEVLADLLGSVGADSLDSGVRTRALRQLSSLTSRAYTRAELSTAAVLPISYLAAPVLDRAGDARYEVQVGPLRAEVSAAERDGYVAELLSATARISELAIASNHSLSYGSSTE